jgi:hypothetical protein
MVTSMDYKIMIHTGTANEATEIIALLFRVFVAEGFTDKSIAERIFVPTELRKRDEIILARSIDRHSLWFFRPSKQ